MLQNPDDAVIWRGPRKNALIKQFLKDVDWGSIDYLVVDAPPGYVHYTSFSIISSGIFHRPEVCAIQALCLIAKAMSDGNMEELEVCSDLSPVLQDCVHNSNHSVLSMLSKVRSELAPQHAKHKNLSNQSVFYSCQCFTAA